MQEIVVVTGASSGIRCGDCRRHPVAGVGRLTSTPAWGPRAAFLRSTPPLGPTQPDTIRLTDPRSTYPSKLLYEISAHTDLVSVYRSSIWCPISRPQPDCLYPPNGIAESNTP